MGDTGYVGGEMWEIEEVNGEDGLPVQQGGVEGGDDVYVAVGKGNSSVAALNWALKHVAKPKDFVYIVHVYPEVRHIPTPLGLIPKNQVAPEQVEGYMNELRRKRSELLRPFMKLGDDAKVIMDTVLIESDGVTDAILELIPVLRIRKLIMGVSKSNIRAVKKGGGKAGQVLKNVPEYCKVTVISEGGSRVAIEEEGSTHKLQSVGEDKQNRNAREGEDEIGDMASCTCFSRKFRS
ncbi:U-box domain-containing protein 35-like [Wolffia australiana]